MADWSSWDSTVHEDVEQIKRIGTAMKIKSDALEYAGGEHMIAIGSTGGRYEVSLDKCTCYDFETRQLPCKHIYRLAIELGLLENLPKIDKKAVKAFKAIIPDEVERYKHLYLDGAITLEKFIKIVNLLQSK